MIAISNTESLKCFSVVQKLNTSDFTSYKNYLKHWRVGDLVWRRLIKNNLKDHRRRRHQLCLKHSRILDDLFCSRWTENSLKDTSSPWELMVLLLKLTKKQSNTQE